MEHNQDEDLNPYSEDEDQNETKKKTDGDQTKTYGIFSFAIADTPN